MQKEVSTHILACNLAVEKSSLIHQAVLSRNGKRKIGIAVLILSGNPTCNFPQLTLFPRVSETSETNLRIQGTPFREHLVEHGFFQYAELVILTLMKGDERVQTVEERADSTLFFSTRHMNFALQELVKKEVESNPTFL